MKLFYFAAKPIAVKTKQLRLQREDFETIRIIGRGAFGEVNMMFLIFNCS